MLLVENDSILEESKRNIFDKYKGRSSTHSCYYWEIRHCCCGMNIEKFGEIFPLCFCAQEDYLDSYEAYIHRQPSTPEERTPLSYLVDPTI